MLFAALLAGALLVPAIARRLAVTALVPYALGIAAELSTRGDRATAVVDASLIVLAVALAVAAALRALRADLRRGAAGGLVLLAAGAGALWSLGRGLGSAAAWRAMALAFGLAVGAASLVWLGRVLRLGAALRRLDDGIGGRTAPDRWPAPHRGDLPWIALGLVGLAAGALAPHVAVVYLGATTTVAAASGYQRRHGAPRSVAVAPIGVAAVLMVSYRLMATIAGPVGLATRVLPDAPFSDAAQTLLALALGLIVWALCALSPLHGVMPGVLLAPVGIALWARVGVPAVPDGLAHWRPLLAPLAVWGIWHAAVTRRPHTALVGLGLLALAALAPTSVRAAALLAVAAVALRLGLARGAALCAAGFGALLGFEAGFRAEVVYTLLGAGGLALAGWIDLAGEPPAGNLPVVAT